MSQRALLAFSMLAMAAAAAVGACEAKPEQQTLCNPGDEIFCRCRGGAAGTKTCLDDGNSFGPCQTAWGSCEEIPTGGGSTTTATNTGGGPPAPGQLLGPCTTDPECGGEMTCPMGFCTKPCTDYQECQPDGDCVLWEGQPTCMPYCVTQADCDVYGQASGCSFTNEAVPAFDIVVCANWADVVLPPDGYECDGDEYCHVGFAAQERVCDSGGCTTGCHAAEDCDNAECTSSSPTVLGTCGSATTDPDVCPGQSVSVTDGVPVDLEGNTSQLADPSEYTGTGSCLGSTPTEEWVYAVTPQQTGILDVYVVPGDTLDPILYARQAPCATGTQIACTDDNPYPGVDEEMMVEVTAGQTIYVFIDGWDTSEGQFLVEFNLAAD